MNIKIDYICCVCVFKPGTLDIDTDTLLPRIGQRGTIRARGKAPKIDKSVFATKGSGEFVIGRIAL